MPITRAVLERQLATAKKEREAALAKVGSNPPKKDPKWRNADARCRQITRRLRTVAAVEQLDAELKARKAAASDEDASDE